MLEASGALAGAQDHAEAEQDPASPLVPMQWMPEQAGAPQQSVYQPACIIAAAIALKTLNANVEWDDFVEYLAIIKHALSPRPMLAK